MVDSDDGDGAETVGNTDEVVIDKPEEDNGTEEAIPKEKVEVKQVAQSGNGDMKILFGENQRSHMPIYWCPNDTNKLMHTNTGIIGTMGTGKTQFTKSMVTQIYR